MHSLREKIQSIVESTFFGLLLVAVAGVSVFSRDFAKIHIGPLYVLEAIFVIWIFTVVLSGQTMKALGGLSRLWAPLLFFLWGIFWLICDVRDVISREDPISYPRVLQHALLFSYPLMWMSVGDWCCRRFLKGYSWIVFVCFLTAWSNVLGQSVSNLSLGPVLTIPWMSVLYALVRDGWKTPRSRLFLLETLALTLTACVPFWWMWLTSVQRTSFLLFLLLVVVVPWAIHTKSESWWLPIKVTATAIFIYGLGQAIVFLGVVAVHKIWVPPAGVSSMQQASSIETPTSKPRIRVVHQIIMAAQHGDDRPVEGNAQFFQMRVRRFMWKTALQDWKQRPIVGIGSIPEVPSSIRPGVANTYNGSVFGTPPIAGPHNSYLTVLARMGIVGSFLLAVILIQGGIRAHALWSASGKSLVDLLLFFVPLSGLVYALFNSGFESPHNCFILWLFSGIMMAKADRSA